MTTIRCGLLAFEGCDGMDLVGPYEVLLTANRLLERRGDTPVFEVEVVGTGEVALYGGLRVVPTTSVADAGRLDVLVVPGAIDLEAATPDEAIRQLAASTEVLASVCTGAFFLQRAGLVGDRAVTTHWEDADLLARHGRAGARRRPVGRQRRAGDLGRHQLGHRDGAAPRREVRRPPARRGHGPPDRLRVDARPLRTPPVRSGV